MTIDTMIMLCGGIVALLPFLGFRNDIDTLIFFSLGVITVALGIVVRRRAHISNTSIKTSHFEERAPHGERHDIT